MEAESKRQVEEDWTATEASTKQSVEDMKEEAAEARQSLAGKIRRDLAEATGSAMKEAQDNTNEAAAKGQEAIRAMSATCRSLEGKISWLTPVPRKFT